MSTLAETIAKDLIVALKAHDEVRLRALRMLKASLQNAAIAARVETLADDAVRVVLKREAKQRREAAAAFAGGGRADLAANEEAELAVLAAYLPPELSEDEIRACVTKLLNDPTVAERSFGTVMKVAMAELKGKADATLVSRVVKELIG